MRNKFTICAGLAALFLFGGVILSQAIDPEVPASEFPPTVRVKRNEKTITVVKYGPDEKGLFIICPYGEDDPTKTTHSVVYDLEPYSVHVTVDKNVIRGSVAVVSTKENGDGRLEVFAGSVTEQPEESDECLPTVNAAPKPGTVVVTQGKTRLSGSKLVYDEADGLAIISGPIEFERPQENDTLRGVSERITIDVDRERTLLEGNVELNTKCRVSKADRVEYDDIKNRAILFGSPAVSRELNGGGEIKGDRLEYDLSNNDVVIEGEKGQGAVKGNIDDAAEACR